MQSWMIVFLYIDGGNLSEKRKVKREKSKCIVGYFGELKELEQLSPTSWLGVRVNSQRSDCDKNSQNIWIFHSSLFTFHCSLSSDGYMDFSFFTFIFSLKYAFHLSYSFNKICIKQSKEHIKIFLNTYLISKCRLIEWRYFSQYYYFYCNFQNLILKNRILFISLQYDN